MINGNTYQEAGRYLKNATDILRGKAKKEGRYYRDVKYVRMACGTAYNAVLLAMDDFLRRRGVPVVKKNHQRINVDDYRTRLAQIDRKMLSEFNNAYNVLHLDGYYEGIDVYDTIKSGFVSAANLINKIKPHGVAGVKLS